MQKHQKIGVGLLIAVIVAACLMMAAYWAINPDKLKTHLLQRIQTETQQVWHIDGPIHWALLPQLSVDLNTVSLNNPIGFPGPLAHIKRVHFTLSFFDLLRNRIVLKSVTFIEPVLHIIHNKQGIANWRMLIHTQLANTATSPDATTATQPIALPLPLPAINVANGTLFFIDQRGKKQWHFKQWTWHSGSVAINHPFTFNTTSKLLTPHRQTDKPLTLAVSSMLTIKPQLSGLKLNNFHLKANIPINSRSKQTMEAALKSNIDWDEKNEALSIKDSTLQANNFVMQFALEGRNLRHPVYALEGTLEVLPFNPKEMANLMDYPWPFLHPKALTYFATKCQLGITQQELALKNCQIKLDNARANAHFLSTWPHLDRLRFETAFSDIHLDKYTLLASPATPSTVAPPLATRNPTHTRLRHGIWRTLSGQVRVDNLQFNQLVLRNVTLTVLGQHGLLQLSPITGELLDGHLNAGLTIDMTTTPVRYTLDQKLSAIAIAPLIKALNGPHNLFSGTANISSHVASQGHHYHDLIGQLKGKGRVEITNGKIKGLDIGQTLSQANALLNGHPLTKTSTASPEGNYTSFDKLTANFYITEGVLRNHDLQFSAPAFQATGKGYVHLPKARINYLLKVRGVKRAQQTAQQETLQLYTWFVPIRFKGSFNHIKVLPDFTVLGKSILSKTLNSNTNNYLEEIKKNVGDTLKKWVK